MNFKYIAAGICALGFMIGWNVFLAQRDAELFRVYDARSEQVRQVENK
jgi:hypothetical protein